MDLSIDIEDRLSLLGLLVGVFVVVVGLGTLLGTPWTTTESSTAVVVQLVGIVATVAVGVVLILVTYVDEPGELVP